jgi:hypothetical protein
VVGGGNWVEIHEQLQGEAGEIVELAEAIQAGGQPASREAWAAQQPQAQQAYPQPPSGSASRRTDSHGRRRGATFCVDCHCCRFAAPTSGAPDSASIADEEELSDDEFDRKGRPKMGGNRRKFMTFLFLVLSFRRFSLMVAI